MDRFVLDFYCPEKRLAVEIDGEIHNAQQAPDKERQEILESMGIRFVRLPARLVEQDIPAALDRIRQATDSNPSPSIAGEGSRGARG